MTFATLHEALRLEILRRIERGILSGTLLARQTGLSQAHISNFIHARRMLTMSALDRILYAQGLSLSSLIFPQSSIGTQSPARRSGDHAYDSVPLVSQSSAIHDPHIAAHDVFHELRLLPGTLEGFRKPRAAARRDWQRFVAIRITALQAEAMEPILSPHAIVLLDRHYASVAPDRPGRLNLFAVAFEGSLIMRYVSLHTNRLIMRTYGPSHPVELIDLSPAQPPSDFVVGRACLLLLEP